MDTHTDDIARCPECGAPLDGYARCEDMFHRALAMEYEAPGAYEAHHLLVGVYMLQHPSTFTPEAQAWYRESIATIVDEGMSAPQLRERTRVRFEQGSRAFDVKAKHPAPPVLHAWRSTIADVVDGPAEELPARVWAWARSAREELREG